jgi:hypothetical protein
MKWPLFVLLFIGLVGLASAVDWNSSAYTGITYNLSEDTTYYHNLSANVTDPDPSMAFSVDTDTDINWTYENGTSLFVNSSKVSEWISITDSSTGNLTINASSNNQTGIFRIPLQVDIGGSGSVQIFVFNISSVNDPPNFTTIGGDTFGDYHSWFENGDNISVYLNASDEEGEYDGTGYPLNFAANISSCNYSASSNRDEALDDCNDLFSWAQEGNKSIMLNITRTNDFVGTYNVTFWVNDSSGQTEFNTTFEINNSNDAPTITFACDDDRSILEDARLDCWVNATDIDEENNITFEINSDLDLFLFNDSSTLYPFDCSGVSGQCNASANISFLTNDSYVGNWSVNISVTDTSGGADNIAWSNFSFFVNNKEDPINVIEVADFIAYENINFTIRTHDDDFLVPDSSVKNEVHTFVSDNTSLLYFLTPSPVRTGGTNYTEATAFVNFSYAESYGITNASINVSITDGGGNSNFTVFTINFSTNSAPNWSAGNVTDYSTNYSIAENDSTWGGLNLFQYVNDSDPGDNITFYFVNSTEFCSLNTTNFNSSTGIVNFTALDCDVGYHLVEIIAGDTKMNSSQNFNFTITNVNDLPTIGTLTINGTGISEGGSYASSEDSQVNFSLQINDGDFLIPSGQKTYYNESLVVNVSVTNFSNGSQSYDFFSDFYVDSTSGQTIFYETNFTPVQADVGNYTVLVNITDNSNSSVSRTFYLNITPSSDPPALSAITNKTLTIKDVLNLTVSATDDEDDLDGATNLSYFIVNLTAGAPNLVMGQNNGTVIFDMGSSEDYAGTWQYNVSVNDSDSNWDSTIIGVTVYGTPNWTSPSENFVFNFTENVSLALNFSINHSVEDNLTYEFWIDSISCNGSNISTNCSYGNLSQRTAVNNLGNGTNFSWPFQPNFSDETYGLIKNLTVISYPNSSGLNISQKAALQSNRTFKLNITHSNSPVNFSGEILDSTGYSYSSGFSLDLGSYFSDTDFSDGYYADGVNFSFSSDAEHSDIRVNDNALPINLTLADWNVTFTGAGPVTGETVWIFAQDFNETNVTMTNVTSNNFTVGFSEPTTVTQVVSGGGGGSTKLKHYSLKIVTPQDIILSGTNLIEVPFSIENNGQIDLEGIHLSSYIQFNNEFSSDISVNLDEGYIDSLKFGQSENFTMKIFANTQRSGKYKATIYANVTSPKFTDWGDFFIDLRKTNETEAEQLLIFTEKFVSENPECLELTEVIHEAERAFSLGEYSNSLRLAQEATDACEEAISKNEQIRFGNGKISNNIYYTSLATLGIFFLGLLFYFYKRVRFNKSRVEEYV